jgi:hypothetical protein
MVQPFTHSELTKTDDRARTTVRHEAEGPFWGGECGP